MVVVSIAAATLPLGAVAQAATPKLTMRAVSTKPQYVTGGDVLVRLRPAVNNPTFTVAGKQLDAKSMGDGAWRVQGLANGASRITAKSGTYTASLAVVNHPTTGPVFSGPHLPLLCSVTAVTTTATKDATCAAPTTTSEMYRSTDGTFKPMPTNGSPPSDVATLTFTSATKTTTVLYIVRIEKGVINRTPYSFAALELPGGWNKRLVYEFGGGCGTSYSQGSPLGTDVLNDPLLSKGYAVATANFNTFQTSCNDVLSAETAMMVKERVAEQLGPIRFTIGDGASGGAIQQLMIAQNYPGILDALSPVIPFPDAISIAPGISDCGLLAHFSTTPAGAGFTATQRSAIDGHLSAGTCALWISSFLGTINPYVGCDPRIPADEIFSATNPKGLRCTLQDLNRNEFGIDATTGFANRPLDNVGVQYGLKALNAGTITVDQFLTLNADIGGYDINGQPVTGREQSTPAQNRRAYATGRVLDGGGSLRRIPIITVNLYSDPFGDIHDRFRLFTIRERLRKDGKVDRNEVIWTRPSNGNIAQALTGNAFDPAAAIALLDRWLTAGSRPKEAVDNCTDANGRLVSGPNVYTQPGPCRDLYPIFGDPRTAAGAPLINDRLKCQRTPVNLKSYQVKFTAAQATKLRHTFPSGVCDWTKPGVGQVPLAATWINYGKPPYAPTK
jgi:hypothetical protein